MGKPIYHVTCLTACLALVGCVDSDQGTGAATHETNAAAVNAGAVGGASADDDDPLMPAPGNLSPAAKDITDEYALSGMTQTARRISDGVLHEVVQLDNHQFTFTDPTRSASPRALTEEQGRALADTWLEKLRKSRYIAVHLRNTRTHTWRMVGESADASTIHRHVVVDADSVMGGGEMIMAAFDDDTTQGRSQDQPAIAIAFRNGEVTEQLWYPAYKDYRITTYPAPDAWGAMETQYQYACQVGLLLATWVEWPDIVQDFENSFSHSALPPTPCVVDGVSCYEFLYDTDPDLDPVATPGREKRMISNFVDEHGVLRRVVKDVTYVTEDGVLHEVKQVEDYTFTFSDIWPSARAEQIRKYFK